MSRSERLFELLQALRRHRLPVSGKVLAAETGVSIRTLYRDIASLQAQGAQIEGEAGVGYVLRPGFMLPPLMFSPEEIEALVLGSRWVAGRADDGLGRAAGNALAKIGAVLPADLRDDLESSTLLVNMGAPLVPIAVESAQLRQAIRAEVKVTLGYSDVEGRASTRVVWPFGMGYFERAQILLAWCEMRADFRHFRLDRLQSLTISQTRYRPNRHILLKRWRQHQDIPPPS